ncbi:MAG: DUF2784 domain-containing protein [Elusimicrobia bacterium]|nr:DUF2784 domain-containing protein [Elusimicrobiota bacterium]
MNSFLVVALMTFHFAWVFFNLTGFFWARRWPVLGKIHAAALGLTVSFFIFLGRCPVTDWEWRLRHGMGEAPRSGGFITHWLGRSAPLHISEEAVGWATIGLFLLSFWLHVARPWWKAKNKLGGLA